MKHTVIPCLMLLVMICGCELQPDAPVFEDTIAVFGFLRGGTVLDSSRAILIARTGPLTEFYSMEERGLTGAHADLTDLGSGTIYELVPVPGRPGFYALPSLTITPDTEYRLEIRAGDQFITARTRVPPTLHVTSLLSSDSLNYVHPDGLGDRMPLHLESGDPEMLIKIDANCRESWQEAEFINPFFGNRKPRSEEQYGSLTDSPPKHITAIGRLKEIGELDDAGCCTVTWYASLIAFYGRYTLQAAAIDSNYHNYVTTNDTQELAGGVSGGIGVFGSLSAVQFELLIQKEDD